MSRPTLGGFQLTLSHEGQRYIVLFFCFLLALGCGTSYMYSAYGPQVAAKLDLSASESSILGAIGTLGLAAGGPLAGTVIDHFPPKIPISLCAFLVFSGYFFLRLFYLIGHAKFILLALCMLSSGIGNAFGMGTSLKYAGLNFPEYRGSATALPMGAFGLSAFFFSYLANSLFPGDTSGVLLLLSLLPTIIAVLAFIFIRLVPYPIFDRVVPLDSEIPDEDENYTDNFSERRALKDGNGKETTVIRHYSSTSLSSSSSSMDAKKMKHTAFPRYEEIHFRPHDVEGNIIRDEDEEERLEQEYVEGRDDLRQVTNFSGDRHIETEVPNIAIPQLVRRKAFWQHLSLLAVLGGTGQMYILVCGFCVRALASKSGSIPPVTVLQSAQALQVGLISVLSSAGRFISGGLSDVLARRGYQRTWLVVVAGLLGLCAHICATAINDLNDLWIVSSLIGLSYGMCFGAYPTITSDLFGMRYFSQNWGLLTSAPVYVVNILNPIFGRIYDAHSEILDDGSRICYQGVHCYAQTFGLTSFLTGIFTLVTLCIIFSSRRRSF